MATPLEQPHIEWQRACPQARRAALVLLPWSEGGVSVAWRDRDGKLWGCRDIAFGLGHEECLNAWTADACREGFKIEDRRGVPKFIEWLSAEVGTSRWCVAARMSRGLPGRYDLVITPRRFAELEKQFRERFGALHLIGLG